MDGWIHHVGGEPASTRALIRARSYVDLREPLGAVVLADDANLAQGTRKEGT